MRKSFLTILLLFLCGVVVANATLPCGTFVDGNRRLAEYIHLLQGKRVGVLSDHNSRIEERHLIDTLLASGVDVKLIFAPEKGFRDEDVVRYGDSYMGIEVINLINRPKANDVFRCDVVVCDLRDEGVRTSSSLRALVRLMRVCADIGVPLVMLDRLNPIGSCVDGAIVEQQYRTSEEILPLPLLHGMTLGELARMINGEGWLSGGVRCPLTVVPCVKVEAEEDDDALAKEEPSDSVVFFSVGISQNVPIVSTEKGIDLSEVMALYAEHKADDEFFVGEEFDRHIGASYVREMMVQGYSAEAICSMWRGDVERFMEQRSPYLIYEK